MLDGYLLLCWGFSGRSTGDAGLPACGACGAGHGCEGQCYHPPGRHACPFSGGLPSHSDHALACSPLVCHENFHRCCQQLAGCRYTCPQCGEAPPKVSEALWLHAECIVDAGARMPFYHGVKDKYVYMQMQRLFTEMDDSDRLLQLQIGLDATGTGSAFVARNLVSAAASCCSITSNIKGTCAVRSQSSQRLSAPTADATSRQ